MSSFGGVHLNPYSFTIHRDICCLNIANVSGINKTLGAEHFDSPHGENLAVLNRVVLEGSKDIIVWSHSAFGRLFLEMLPAPYSESFQDLCSGQVEKPFEM